MVGYTKYKADAGYKRGTYNENLTSLVNDDYEQFGLFLFDGEFADVSGIVTVRCEDYRLTRGLGAAGSADILTGMFYEEGLIEYSEQTAGEMYDRFRKDYFLKYQR